MTNEVVRFDERIDWKVFCAEHWGRSVVHVPGCSDHPFASDDVFLAAVAAGEQHLQASPSRGRRRVVVTVAQRELPVGPADLPRREDRSLERYARRMTERMGSKRYALVMSVLHAHGYPLWEKERRFLERLWRGVGIPTSGVITTLFHGNYAHTPVGVHLDRFATFMFALRGRKRMRFWRTKPWKERVSSKVDYGPYLAQSFSVNVAPGDMLYWPTHLYHVGEGVDDDVATSVNIGVPISGPVPSYYLDDLLTEWRSRDSGTPADSFRASRVLASAGSMYADPSQVGLPPVLSEAIEAVRAATQPADLLRHSKETWLRRVSAAALEPVPGPAALEELRPKDGVQLNPDARLLWANAPSDVIVCSTNGHMARIQGSPRVEDFIRRLEAGAPQQVCSLVEGLPDGGTIPCDAELLPASKPGVIRLLERLVAYRGLRRRRDGF